MGPVNFSSMKSVPKASTGTLFESIIASRILHTVHLESIGESSGKAPPSKPPRLPIGDRKKSRDQTTSTALPGPVLNAAPGTQVSCRIRPCIRAFGHMNYGLYTERTPESLPALGKHLPSSTAGHPLPRAGIRQSFLDAETKKREEIAAISADAEGCVVRWRRRRRARGYPTESVRS